MKYDQLLSHIQSVAGLTSSEADRIENASPELDASGADSSTAGLGILCDTLRLWAKVLSNARVQEAYARNGIPQGSGSDTWIEAGHLALVEQALEKLQSPLGRAEIASLGNNLRTVLRSIFRRSDLLEPTMDSKTAADWLRLKYDVLLRLEELNELVLHRAVDRATSAAVESERGAEAVARAAGKTGDEVMSSFYAALATSEKKNANIFRVITVCLAASAVVLSGVFVAGHSLASSLLDIALGDYVHLIQRAVFILGLFGVAGYFARQAHQHRSMANWAESLSVQLNTFDAYVAAVEDPAVRDELRKSFAARAFGDHPAMKGEPSVAPSAAAMDTAVGWAAKLMPGGK